METNNDEKIAKIREEHSQRVFDLYESKSKSFRNLLTGVTGFALAFFLLILLPYFSIQMQSRKIVQHLESLPAEIAQRDTSIAACQSVEKSVRTLRDEITAGPQKLRDFIRTLKNPDAQQTSLLSENPPLQEANAPIFLQMAQQNIQQSIASHDSCERLSGDEWVKCKVRAAVIREFDDYGDIINQSILPALQAPEVAGVVSLDTTSIRQGLDSLRIAFNKKFEANTEFWRTLQGKGSFFVELDEEVKRFWSKYGALLQTQSDKLKNEVAHLEESKTDLEQQVTHLEKTKEEVSARLSQIESPLGKLPVGLNESILIFPLVLAIGFWLYASSFYETAKLRRAFHDFYLQKDPQQIILTDQQIALIAPLWMDPINTEQNWKLKLAVLLLPIFFFVVACGLIIYLWTLPSALSSPIQPWVYGGLYGLSLGLFGYGYWQVKEALQQYKRG
ncbi:hypothetical protein L0337_44905 [candidate division KSB1 bacterium]|nr:hypothetical protein [candidate division KSB1 bacterium]